MTIHQGLSVKTMNEVVGVHIYAFNHVSQYCFYTTALLNTFFPFTPYLAHRQTYNHHVPASLLVLAGSPVVYLLCRHFVQTTSVQPNPVTNISKW